MRQADKKGHARVHSRVLVQRRERMAIMNKIIAVMALCVVVFAAGVQAKAMELNNVNIGKKIQNSKLPFFVMFYTPSCDHCTALKPTWDSLAENTKDKAVIGRVDCEDKMNKAICNAEGVIHYPTLKSFSTGRISSSELYDGETDMNTLLQFVNTSMGPGCDPKTLTNCSDDDKKIIEEHKGVNVGELRRKLEFYTGKIIHEDKIFEEVLKSLDERYKEARSANSEAKKAYNAKLKIFKALHSAADGDLDYLGERQDHYRKEDL